MRLRGLPEPKVLAVPASWNEQREDLFTFFGRGFNPAVAIRDFELLRNSPDNDGGNRDEAKGARRGTP